MSGFDYGNARLRAMKSRLLTKQELDTMTEVDSLQGVISELTKTAYRKSIEIALARVSGKECIGEALRQDLVDSLGRVRHFFNGQTGEMVSIVLGFYDAKNLKVVLRGLEKNVPPAEILNSVLPVGDLTANILAELARAPSPRAAIDLTASMGLPFAHSLLKLRAEFPGVSTISEMELAIDRWYFERALEVAQSVRGAGRVLLPAIQLEADLVNLPTALRFAHSPEERKFLRQLPVLDDLADLFVGPGKLPFALLGLAGRQDTVDAAVEAFTGTVYEPSLRSGLDSFAQSARLSEFERHLRRYRLNWMSRQITKDPLGIGVLLGFLALKNSEIQNIRWIVEGIHLGMEAEAIRASLEYTE